MVSLTEWATRRLIIVIVGTAAVTGVGATAFGRYVIPAQPDGEAGNPAAPAPVVVSPPTGETPVVVPEPTEDAAEEARPAEDGSALGTPTRLNEFGIPVGYPRTEAGAISACGNYISTFDNIRNREPSIVENILRTIANEEDASRLAGVITDADSQTAENFGVASIFDPRFYLNFRTLGYKVDNYSDEESSVTIFAAASVGVVGGTTNLQPGTHWGTTHCKVRWDGEDWKLADASDGPDWPTLDDQSSNEFLRFALVGVKS